MYAALNDLLHQSKILEHTKNTHVHTEMHRLTYQHTYTQNHTRTHILYPLTRFKSVSQSSSSNSNYTKLEFNHVLHVTTVEQNKYLRRV